MKIACFLIPILTLFSAQARAINCIGLADGQKPQINWANTEAKVALVVSSFRTSHMTNPIFLPHFIVSKVYLQSVARDLESSDLRDAAAPIRTGENQQNEAIRGIVSGLRHYGSREDAIDYLQNRLGANFLLLIDNGSGSISLPESLSHGPDRLVQRMKALFKFAESDAGNEKTQPLGAAIMIGKVNHEALVQANETQAAEQVAELLRSANATVNRILGVDSKLLPVGF